MLLKVDLRDIQVGSAAPPTKKPGWWFIFVESWMLRGSFINARCAFVEGRPFDGNEALDFGKNRDAKSIADNEAREALADVVSFIEWQAYFSGGFVT